MRAPLWLSTLESQRLMLGSTLFLSRWPQDWLVRMMGPRRPAATVEARDLAETMLPGAGASSVDETDCQAWCLEWAGTPLSVGRAGVNDFVINDVTMPRVAGLLVCREHQWWWRAVGSDVEQPLPPQQMLRLGEIELRVVSAELMDEVLASGAGLALRARVGTV